MPFISGPDDRSLSIAGLLSRDRVLTTSYNHDPLVPARTGFC